MLDKLLGYWFQLLFSHSEQVTNLNAVQIMLLIGFIYIYFLHVEVITEYYLKLPVLNRLLYAIKLFLGLSEITNLLFILHASAVNQKPSLGRGASCHGHTGRSSVWVRVVELHQSQPVG